ncbi:unnamed protein product [Ectocarpus sp. 13 AM-2016]
MFTAVPFDNVHDRVYFTFSRTMGPISQSIDTQDVPPALVLGSRSRSEAATTAIEPSDATPTKTTEDNPPTQFEAFEYQDLADVAKTVKGAFDDLTGDILTMVNALVATYDENSAKQRQGLEECMVAFNKAVEGDFDTRLDIMTQQCTERHIEEKEKTEAAQAGLVELEEQTVARLEALGKVLKDRQETVLVALKHEREANTRKILASTLGDPLEEGRTLFNKQVEETELEGKLKQRRRLLDLNSQGVSVQQEEIETAMLKASRDEVENLMQVVDKMQHQQTKLLVTLQAEKKNISAMRQHVGKRLGASTDNESTTTISPREGEPSGEKQRHASKKGKTAAIAVTAAFTMSNPGEGILDDGDSLDVISQLSGIELLHACERLENHNVTLRQRLAKLELQTMQKEHGGDEDELNKTDSRLPRVLETKKELEGKLEGLQMANEERSKELERIRGGGDVPTTKSAGPTPAMSSTAATIETTGPVNRPDANGNSADDFMATTTTLTQKVKTLRRKLVFNLACNDVKRRFKEAGLGPGNDPNPPKGPVVVDNSQLEDAGSDRGLPPEMQVHAARLEQKNALQREIERTERREQELQHAIENATSTNRETLTDGNSTGKRLAGEVASGGEDVIEGCLGRGGSESNRGGGEEQNGRRHTGKRPSTREDEGVGDGGEGQPKLKKSKMPSQMPTEAASVGTTAANMNASAKLRTLQSMQATAQKRLDILRSLAEKNEEAVKENDLDAVDSEAVEAVLRNESIAREKALAVLDLLCSREMAKARTRWLKQALERSMKEIPAIKLRRVGAQSGVVTLSVIPDLEPLPA